MSTNVYVLKCQNGKRYVGKSSDIEKRFEQHKKGNGSEWTNKYKPISIEHVYKNVSHFEEDKVVKETMAKYGINNVRGGTYSSVKLNNIQKNILEKEIRGAQDSCLNCGSSNHFAKSCYKSHNSQYYDEEDSDDSEYYSDDDYDNTKNSIKNNYSNQKKTNTKNYDDNEDSDDSNDDGDEWDDEDEDDSNDDGDDYYD